MYLKTKMSKVYERACVTAGSILKDHLLALASSFFGRFSWSMRRHVASTLLRTPVGVIGWLVGFVTPILSPFIFPGGRLGRISDPFAVGEISISTFVSTCYACPSYLQAACIIYSNT